MRSLAAAPLLAGALACACTFNTAGRDPASADGPTLSDGGGDHPALDRPRGERTDRLSPSLERPPERAIVDKATSDKALVDKALADKLAPDKLAPDKLAPDKLAPDKLAPDKPPPCAGLVCALGCNTALGRCNRVAPANGASMVATAFDQVSAGLTVSALTTLNTNTGAITVPSTAQVIRQGSIKGLSDGIWWELVPQGTGYPELAVFVLTSLDVQATRELRVTGSRAALIYVTGDATISGRLVAWPSTPGGVAGGFAGGVSDSDGASCFGGEGTAGWSSGDEDSGGGGGGRGAAGGRGGNGGSAAGGVGGASNGAVTLVPLYGGCGGGGGGYGGDGGGGGGAIHLAVNGNLILAASGQISAPGGKGAQSTLLTGGGGGGSGGALLLEAAKLTLAGALAANGGGGGAGGSLGEEGSYGTHGVLGGAGGDPDVNESSYSGRGGNGGGLATGKGQNGADVTHNGGGGGGGVGRIRINGSTVSFTTLTVSPAASSSATVATW